MTTDTGYIGLEKLLTATDVAAVLQVSPRAVRSYRETGKLPAVKFGAAYRYQIEDVRHFIEAHRCEPKEPTL